MLNGFAAEDLIGELSLLIASSADCGSGQPVRARKPRRFLQTDAQMLETFGLFLRYVRETAKQRWFKK